MHKHKPYGTTFASLLVLMTLVIACNSAAEPAEDPNLTRLDITNSRGETVRLSVEVADTEDERGHGLSNRSSLDRDAGMLFVFEGRNPGFWMKDTSIPLSVAFIEECGEIINIADMQPQSLQIHQGGRPYAFGLEVNQGWFTSHAIAAGSTVAIPDEFRADTCD